MSDDLTLGEIGRALKDLKTDIKAEVASLRIALGELNFVRPDVFDRAEENFDLRIGYLEDRVKRQEENTTWMTRTIAVALLGVVANIVVFVLTRT